MYLSFRCGKCSTALRIDAKNAGAQIHCPKCQAALQVPPRQMGPGTIVGGFRIETLLGRGGMGEVYLAHQISLDRPVALKILPPSLTAHPERVARFRDEVRHVARLDHPNIVTAYEAGEDGGVHYLAMSYVEGQTLDQRIDREGPLPEADALNVLRKVGAALAHAWDTLRLIHRDINPANIIITSDLEPRLLDLGLSKSLDDELGRTLVAGEIMGTPNYMSPEQAQGKRDLDFRSDIYSLGLTLHFMLTGRIPFEGGSLVEVLHRQLTESLPDPRTLGVPVSDGCLTLLEAMLARQADLRPASWDDVLASVNRVRGGRPPGIRTLPPDASAMARGPAAPPPAVRPGGVKRTTHHAPPTPAAAGSHPAPGAGPRLKTTEKPHTGLQIAIWAAVIGAFGLGLGLWYWAERNAQREAEPPPPPVPAPGASTGTTAAATKPKPATPAVPVPAVPATPTPAAAAVPAEWAPFRYGLLLHFSLQTFTGSSESDSPERFAPTNLDARAWARAARQAGMSFAVLTVKHEDGFCLWDTAQHELDIARSPVDRDLLGDFVAACRAEYVVPGVYYSTKDAFVARTRRETSPAAAPRMEVMKAQLAELVTRYPDLGIVIVKFGGVLPTPQYEELRRAVTDVSPRCVVVREIDPAPGPTSGWMCTDAMSHWFWKPEARPAAATAITAGYETARRAGVPFLVSVGPDLGGRIPDPVLAVVMDASLSLGFTSTTSTTVEVTETPAESPPSNRVAGAAAAAADRLLHSDFPGARQQVGGDAAGAVSGEEAAGWKALRAQVEAVCGMAEVLSESFRRQAGQDAVVELDRGAEQLRIVGVTGNLVRAERIVKVDGREAGRARADFTLADLTPTETLRRLGSARTPETDLMRGLVALSMQASAQARQLFAAAPSPLGPALATRLDELADKRKRDVDSARMAATEQSAATAFQTMARALSLPLDDASPDALRRAVLKRRFSEAEVKAMRSNVAVFRERFGPTQFALEHAGVLEAMGRVIPGLPRYVEPEKVAAAIKALETKNPGEKIVSLADVQDDGVTLDLSKNRTLSDISPLTGLPLVSLNLYETFVTDLTPLKGMPLERLGIGETGVTSLEALRGLSLTSLSVRLAGPNATLAPLEGMPLRWLSFHRRNEAEPLSLRPLTGMPLGGLAVESTRLEDLRPLQGMPLTNLIAHHCGLSDLAPLKGLPLTRLDINYNTGVRDLSPLRGMPLKWLSVAGCRVSDLHPLEGMALETLYIGSTAVTDFSPLKGMPLTILGVENLKLSDLSPLLGMPLIQLNLNGCPPFDPAVLRQIPTLKDIRR